MILTKQHIYIMNTLGDLATPHLMNWLEEHGFFTAPASGSHHGNKTGDLVIHSIDVAKTLNRLTAVNGSPWQRSESPFIVGLLHDLCKVDNYIPGGEDDRKVWMHNPNEIMKGHGDKSIMMASTLMQLTEEEMFCIRFHMGAFTDQSEWQYYRQAVQKYPNVLWTHQADMIAAFLMGR